MGKLHFQNIFEKADYSLWSTKMKIRFTITRIMTIVMNELEEGEEEEEEEKKKSLNCKESLRASHIGLAES